MDLRYWVERPKGGIPAVHTHLYLLDGTEITGVISVQQVLVGAMESPRILVEMEGELTPVAGPPK